MTDREQASFSAHDASPALVLGTAQLGLAYGAANRVGLPAEDDAVELIRTAVRSGIRTIDTARAYGDAERRLGLSLSEPSLPRAVVVTKLDPLAALPLDAGEDVVRAATLESLTASRSALRRARLDVVLLHRAAHRTQWRGVVWHTLARERDMDRIGALGVSAQSPGEVIEAIGDPLVTHVQLPFNILDHRWVESGVVGALTRRPDITVHVRSVFLQGLLSAGIHARWPTIDRVDPAAIIAQLDGLASRCGRADRLDLCLAFVRAQDWIDGVVIGVETADQLAANLALFKRDSLAREAQDMVTRALPRLPTVLLDPAKWSVSNSDKLFAS